MSEPFLRVEDLSVSYSGYQVLWNVSFEVRRGEIVAMMGPNGSGKSTVLKAIMHLTASRSGKVNFEGRNLMSVPTHEMVENGISMVLERRRLFPQMTVRENVLLGAYHRSVRGQTAERLEWVEELFPILKERRNQVAGRMSGGEQQMVSIARSLMSKPRLLLMDEPYLGLAPKVVDHIAEIIRRINAEGISVLFNEQNVPLSFGISHRGYLLESGRIVAQGTGSELMHSDIVRRVYLGS